MKICHIISSLDFGGAERQVLNLINNIEAAEKYLIIFSKKKSGFQQFLNEDVNLIIIPMRLRMSFYYILKISFFLKKHKIDVLQTHMYWPNLYGSIAGRLAGVPAVFTTEHGKNKWKKKWHSLIERFVITSLADNRICVSNDILFLRNTRDRVSLKKLLCIPNGLNIPREYSKKRKNNKKIIIGSIGRFIEAKDFSTLIKACSILKKKSVDFHLYILGDGELRHKLIKDINYYNLSENISLPGFKKNVGQWMKMFDVFIISSVREGQPLVLLEAMSYGLPIVSTNVGGIPDTARNKKEALLVNPGKADEICFAVIHLIKNRIFASFLSKNARKRVANEYSIDICCNKHLKLYNRVLNKKNEIISR